MPHTVAASLPGAQRVPDVIAHWEANTNLEFVQRTAANQAKYPNWVHFEPIKQVWRDPKPAWRDPIKPLWRDPIKITNDPTQPNVRITGTGVTGNGALRPFSLATSHSARCRSY